jgi:DNA repair protein RadC
MDLNANEQWSDPDERPTKEERVCRKPIQVTETAGGLPDAELLRLVLGDKSPGLISELLDAEPGELVAANVLTKAQGARLAGALELCRRLSTQRDQRPRLHTASAVWNWVRPTLTGLRREVFRVLCIDARSRLLRDVRAAEGSVDSCHVDPREVFAPAVACRASAVVLVHNHPSGDPEPSSQDIQLTKQLVRGGELLCIKVLDHVVVSETGFVSMSQRHML